MKIDFRAKVVVDVICVIEAKEINEEDCGTGQFLASKRGGVTSREDDTIVSWGDCEESSFGCPEIIRKAIARVARTYNSCSSEMLKAL